MLTLGFGLMNLKGLMLMNKYDEAIDLFIKRHELDKNNFDLILEALQQAKERSVGCRYCNVDNMFTETGLDIISKPYLKVCIAKQPFSNTFYLVTSEYEKLKNITGQYDNSPFRSDKKEIHKCPICGRKLSDKPLHEENPPLTLDQLKERVGKPVWVKELEIWCILIEDTYPDDRCGKYFIKGAYNVGCSICYSIKLHNYTLYDHEPKGD